jgi:putative membrane protein
LPADPFNRFALALFLVVWAVSCIRLPYPEYFAMQHVPTVLAVIGLIVADKRWGIDRLSYAFIILFLLLHVLGARYLYSYVPYDDWSKYLLGFRVTDYLGFERNHYDRLVHFCFGLLITYPAWKVFDAQLGLRGIWPGALAISVVLSASAVYEIIEWAMAMTLAPDWAEAYNGQQGDVWDAQRDMALAACGAVLSLIAIGFQKRK